MSEHARSGTDGPPVELDRRAVRVLVPFAIVGTIAILAGGAVAAAARPAGWDQGSWAAAYLVLPTGLGTGVGGMALGLLPGRGGTGSPDRIRAPWFLGAWIVGNALVLVGNLLAIPVLLGSGAVMLLAVLIASAVVLRRAAPSGPWLTAYLAGVLLLVVSVPVGLLLATR